MDEQPDLNSQSAASTGGAFESRSEREARVAAIRAAVERDLEDIRNGQVTDVETALDRIERMLDEIEAVKRG